MNTINTLKAESKIVIFEPGNATRYYLVLTQTSEYNFVMVDMNNHIVVEFSAKYIDELAISIRLKDKGYSSGDAEPMAKYLTKIVMETAYITYEKEGPRAFLNRETVWFEDTEKDWEEHLVSIGEEGGNIIERGRLNWDKPVSVIHRA